MKRSDTETGKFISRATPLGTVDENMVVKRAKEIAVTNGRNGNSYTPEDFEQARCELVGFPNTEFSERETSTPDTGSWLGEAGDRGDRAAVRPAKDEQTFAEELVKEGVEEATHHQILAGNQTSREHDED